MNGSRIPVVIGQSLFRTAYGPRERVQLDTGEESNVKQSFRDEVDVNEIVVRFRNTGVLPGGEVVPQYLDVSELPSYHEALSRLRAVDAFFATLPAETREAFQNDPGVFLDYVSDPANEEEALAYGVTTPAVDGGSAVAEGLGGSAPAAPAEAEASAE